MKSTWTRGPIALLLLLLLSLPVGMAPTGCFGRFQLTRYVYELNGAVPTRLLRTVVCWALLIIPVYEVSALLDFFIFNLLEFWLDANPLAPTEERRAMVIDGEEHVLTMRWDGRAIEATLERYREGRLVSTVRLRDEGAGTVSAVREIEGRPAVFTTAALAEDDSVVLTTTSEDGVTRQRREPAEVGAARSRVARLVEQLQRRDAPSAPATPAAPQRVAGLAGGSAG